MSSQSRNDIQTYQRYLNGAISGWIEVTSTHWVDVLKTRIQAEKEINPKVGVGNLSHNIWRKEGLRGFYRGYISRMAGVGPMRAVFWGTMDTVCFFPHHFVGVDSFSFRSIII